MPRRSVVLKQAGHYSSPKTMAISIFHISETCMYESEAVHRLQVAWISTKGEKRPLIGASDITQSLLGLESQPPCGDILVCGPLGPVSFDKRCGCAFPGYLIRLWFF